PCSSQPRSDRSRASIRSAASTIRTGCRLSNPDNPACAACALQREAVSVGEDREARPLPFVEVPVERISREALDGLIEEFVTRDGTDYGLQERTLEEKKRAVARQLDRGEVVILFDPESETCNIVPK